MEVPSQGSVTPGSGWQSFILESPVCEPDGSAETIWGTDGGKEKGPQ